MLVVSPSSLLFLLIVFQNLVQNHFAIGQISNNSTSDTANNVTTTTSTLTSSSAAAASTTPSSSPKPGEGVVNVGQTFSSSSSSGTGTHQRGSGSSREIPFKVWRPRKTKLQKPRQVFKLRANQQHSQQSKLAKNARAANRALSAKHQAPTPTRGTTNNNYNSNNKNKDHSRQQVHEGPSTAQRLSAAGRKTAISTSPSIPLLQAASPPPPPATPTTTLSPLSLPIPTFFKEVLEHVLRNVTQQLAPLKAAANKVLVYYIV